MPGIVTKTPKANHSLSSEELRFADIGAYLGFNKSFQALSDEAKQSGVAISEKQVQALIRTGKRQDKLGLPMPSGLSCSKAC